MSAISSERRSVKQSTMARGSISRRFVATVVLACACVAGAPAQCPFPTWQPGDGLPGIQGETTVFTGVVGEVNSSIAWDPDGAGPAPANLVIGGTFAYAGLEQVANIAMWNGSEWSTLGTGMDGPVLSLAVAPNGHLLAGGFFMTAGGVTVNNIADWNGSAWAPFGDGVNGSVTGIVVRANGHVITVGQFDVAGASVVARGIARWDGTDWFAVNQGLRTGTTGNDPGAADTVAMVANGDIVVGGIFDRAGGAAAANIARLRFAANGTTSSWFAMGSGTDGYVSDIDVLPNGDLIAGGSFFVAGGITVNGVARWNGSTWSAMGPGIDGAGVVDVAHTTSGEVVVAGVFDLVGTTHMRGLARWNGSAWTRLGDIDPYHYSYYDSALYSLTQMPGGDLVVGGVLKGGVVHWNGSSWANYGVGFNSDVTAMAVLPGGDVVAGGTFDSAGAVQARHVARFDGAAWHPMATGLDYAPTTLLALPNADVIAGGLLVPSGGGPATGQVSRWNGTSWTLMSEGFNANKFAVLTNGDLVAAGYQAGVGGVFRWTGTSWVLLDGPFSLGVETGFAYALQPLPGGGLLVGGAFDSVNGVPAFNIAKWDGVSWSALGTGIGVPDGVDSVMAITLTPAGDIIAGGWFVMDMNSQPLNAIVQWDGTAWSTIGGGFPDSGVSTLLTLADGRVLAAGAIAYPVQVWDGIVWTPIGSGVEGYVNSVAQLHDGDIAIGGGFAYVAGSPSAHFAIWGCAGSGCDSIDFNGDGLFPDTQDIDDFISVFSGGACSTGTCGDIDFNNDGLFPDTSDIDSLLSVFSGGACV